MFKEIFKSADTSKNISLAITLFASVIAISSAVFSVYLYLSKNEDHKDLPDIINFPSYTSDWMGGGFNADTVCRPIKDKFSQANPMYDIQISASEERRKQIFGRVEYKYTCHFIGQRKPETPRP